MSIYVSRMADGLAYPITTIMSIVCIYHVQTMAWKWEYLSRIMPMTDIDRYPHLPWNAYAVALRSDTNVDTLLAMERAGHRISWRSISNIVPMDEVRSHPGLPWSRSLLSKNKGITLYDVRHLDMPNATGAWDWRSLLRVLPISDIVNNPEIVTDISAVASNRGLTMASARTLGLLDMPSQSIVWMRMPRVLPMTEIRDNPHLPWSRVGLSKNKGITLDDILYLDMPNAKGDWRWESISLWVPITDVRDNPDMPWVPKFLSFRRDLTMDIIYLIGPSKKWDWAAISRNASTDDILDNPGFPWNKKAITLQNGEVDMGRLIHLGGFPPEAETMAMPVEVARREGGVGMSYVHGLTIEDVLYLNG